MAQHISVPIPNLQIYQTELTANPRLTFGRSLYRFQRSSPQTKASLFISSRPITPESSVDLSILSSSLFPTILVAFPPLDPMQKDSERGRLAMRNFNELENEEIFLCSLKFNQSKLLNNILVPNRSAPRKIWP